MRFEIVPAAGARSKLNEIVPMIIFSDLIKSTKTLGQTHKCAVLLIPISPELSKHDP